MSLEDQHIRDLIKQWDQSPQEFFTSESQPMNIPNEDAVAIFQGLKQQTTDGVTSKNYNPFGLNLIAEGTQIIIHVDEIKDTSKGGIKLTEAARKELEEAEAKKDSKLYYIIGVSETVAQVGKYRPGQWVVMRPGIDAQSVRINGKLFILTEAYNISATVTFHEDKEVEEQYSHV